MKNKFLLLISIAYILFTTACTAVTKDIIEQDLKMYSSFNSSIDKQINNINGNINKAVVDYKNNKNLAQYNRSMNNIAREIDKFIYEQNINKPKFATSNMKKIHKLNIKRLKTQKKFVLKTMQSFQKRGEHGGIDTKMMEIKFNKKLRKIDKKKTREFEKLKTHLEN